MSDLDFSTETLERILFKKCLTDKTWLNILSNCFDKRWFKNEILGCFVKLCIVYYNKYNISPNFQTLTALVDKYLEKYPDIFKKSDAQELISEISSFEFKIPDEVLNNNLKGFIRKKAFEVSLYDNAELLTKDSNAFETVVDKCLANFDKVQKLTFNDTDIGLNYFETEAMLKHWDFIKNPEAKLATGWESLDQYTNGGFLKDGKMLALVMAQAGLGKSLFLSNLAVNFMRQNLSVVVISLEMSQDVYAQRFDAHISKNNINRLKDNSDNSISKIKEFYAQYPKANLFIKEYPPRSIRTKDIQVYLENLKNAGHHFDVIIVDYLNLVLPNVRSDSMYKDGLTVSEELRALSYQFNVPVISAVQANSEGMNTENIDMQNVSESRGIVHTTDCLFALYQTEENREQGNICLRVIKNRLGGMVGKLSIFNLNHENLILSDITFNKNYDIAEGEETSENILNSFNEIQTDLTKF